MSYLLDTNVVSEAKRSQPDERVLQWLASQPLTTTYLSVITIGELEEGITALGETHRAGALRAWLEGLSESFSGRTLEVDRAVATTWGRIQTAAKQQGRTPPAIDALIAATAITHDLTLVTRNIEDVAVLPVKTFNPWTFASRSYPGEELG